MYFSHLHLVACISVAVHFGFPNHRELHGAIFFACDWAIRIVRSENPRDTLHCYICTRTWVGLDWDVAFWWLHCCSFGRRKGCFFQRNNPRCCFDWGWESKHCRARRYPKRYLQQNWIHIKINLVIFTANFHFCGHHKITSYPKFIMAIVCVSGIWVDLMQRERGLKLQAMDRIKFWAKTMFVHHLPSCCVRYTWGQSDRKQFCAKNLMLIMFHEFVTEVSPPLASLQVNEMCVTVTGSRCLSFLCVFLCTLPRKRHRLCVSSDDRRWVMKSWKRFFGVSRNWKQMWVPSLQTWIRRSQRYNRWIQRFLHKLSRTRLLPLIMMIKLVDRTMVKRVWTRQHSPGCLTLLRVFTKWTRMLYRDILRLSRIPIQVSVSRMICTVLHDNKVLTISSGTPRISCQELRNILRRHWRLLDTWARMWKTTHHNRRSWMTWWCAWWVRYSTSKSIMLDSWLQALTGHVQSVCLILWAEPLHPLHTRKSYRGWKLWPN